MERKSEIQSAVELLSHIINGIRENTYDEERAKEMQLFKDQLLKQRRMTYFQKIKFDWLKSL